MAEAFHLKTSALGDLIAQGTLRATTDECLATLLNDRSPLHLGQELLLACSPEREDPGNPDQGAPPRAAC